MFSRGGGGCVSKQSYIPWKKGTQLKHVIDRRSKFTAVRQSDIGLTITSSEL